MPCIPLHRHTTPPPIRRALPSRIQLLSELAALAEPRALPVEDVDWDDDGNGKAREDRGRVLERVFRGGADVFVDLRD